MLAGLVALTLLWAMRWPMPWNLAAYLVTQLVCLIGFELSWRLIGPGKVYGCIYVGLTALIFVAIGRLVLEGLATARYRARCLAIGLILAVLFARLAYLGLARPAEWFDWIIITEGALLVWSGVLMGMSAPYMRLPDIALGLGTLWLAQALIAFGYVLHFPAWNHIGVYARPIAGILGFAFIGLRLHQRHRRLVIL
jgi:hypothetical protein